MPYAITYTADVEALSVRATELCQQGKWAQYMHLDDGLQLILVKVRTAYATDSLASLCMIRLPLRDIIGDPDDAEYVPFVDDVGLNVLAYGENRGADCPYMQIENDAAARALYETVLPPIELLDENDQPTGETRFNKWIEFDRTPRNE